MTRMMSPFELELQAAINRCSKDGESDTPDFILAQYLGACLAAWNEGVIARETWYSRGHVDGTLVPATINDQAMREARGAGLFLNRQFVTKAPSDLSEQQAKQSRVE